MLIRFRVKNFLSFADKDGKSIEFSMIPGNVKGREEHLNGSGLNRTLKIATIYGANAAGKSNLVQAMGFMRHLIVRGIPKMSVEKYCKNDKVNRNKPTYFEIELSIDNKYYSYGFEIILSEGKVVSEWLVELRSDDEEVIIFRRDVERGECEFINDLKLSNDIKKKLEVYSDDIRKEYGVLLLKAMNENKEALYKKPSSLDVLKNVFAWISNSWVIRAPQQPITDYSYAFFSGSAEKFKQLVAYFKLGIKDIKLEDVGPDNVMSALPLELRKMLERDINEAKTTISRGKKATRVIGVRSGKNFFVVIIDTKQDVKCKVISIIHNNGDLYFSMNEESDGTVRLMDLLQVLLDNGPRTFVIDELDRCLHPSLTYQFVKSYLEVSKKKDIQLIVTTHESRLLDFSLLRRDEVWFVDKDDRGNSDIYSLDEYNDRFDKCIDKAYLEGRYGGVPIFNALFPVEEFVK